MSDQKKFLVDVGMKNMPFPIKAISKSDEKGQSTIADISVSARIMQEFETSWIDRFIQILHSHRNRIEPSLDVMRINITDYLEGLSAKTVKISFNYPYFIEKTTPVSKEKCLVRYMCDYTAKLTSVDDEPSILFKMQIPAITTYPASNPMAPGGLFGQITMVDIEIDSTKTIYPEDVVAVVDKHALSPVYSYLTQEDQGQIIQKVHSERKTSVEMTDGIRRELAREPDIDFYSIRCTNNGMLHPYATVIGTEKNSWVPFSGGSEEI